MYKISDEQGNHFFVESKELACRIINKKDNPFVNVIKYTKNAPKGEIVKSYEHFLEYFY